MRQILSACCVLFIFITTNAQTTLLTESFDGTTFPPTGWKNQKIGGPTLPGNYNRVTAGTSPTNTPHSGTGEARYNSFNYLAGTTADLVTPAIDFSTTGIYTVSFWMYRENSAPAAVDKIDVYVNTIQNSAGGTYMGTINRNRAQSPSVASNGWYQYTFTVPAGYSGTSNYIAFKATSGFGANMYIDDVTVQRNTAVTPGCLSTFTPSSASTSICRNMTLTWSSVLYATSYKLTMGTNAPDYNNLYNNVDIGNVFTYSPTLLLASTTYNWKLVPTNVYGDATGCTFNNFTTGASVCYCTPTYTEGSCISEDYIDNFSTTGGATNITNNGTGCSADAINNFTYFSSQTVTATQGAIFNVSMQPGPDFPEGFGIWADWNQDGDFDDASEFVFASPTADITVVNGTVTVPVTALTGTTRFRVRCQFNFPPTLSQSCTNFEDGETEDYNITVTACTPITFFADADSDMYGDALISTSACIAPTGYVSDNTDCNDANASTYPGATEICNGIDDNCAGGIDEGLTFLNYYLDEDDDLYGSSAASPVNSCIAISGSVTNNTDCNDENSLVNPAAIETCNGIDDNCISGIDDGLTFIIYYQDADSDNYGNTLVSSSTCSGAPAGYVTDNTDCNDAAASAHPGATEICNSIDDDCDTAIDEGVINSTVTAGGPTTFCQPGSVLLSVQSGYTSYQWKKNGANVSGATSASYTATATANYTVTITSGTCSATSSGVIVTSVKKPKATITTPNGLDLCVVSPVLLRANNGTGITYQWYKDGSAISGATSRDYTTTVTGSFYVRVTNSTGCFKNSPSVTVVKPCRLDVEEGNIITIYPNPTSQNFTLVLKTGNVSLSYATIEVINMMGEKVMDKTIQLFSGEVSENLQLPEGTSAGMYMVKVHAGEQECIQQLVISK